MRIFRGTQTEEAEEFLKERLDKFALIALGVSNPDHHKNVRKCRSCRFFDNCEYKIAN